MKDRNSLLVSLFLVAWMWATAAAFVLSMLSPTGWLIMFLPSGVVEARDAIAALFSATAKTSF